MDIFIPLAGLLLYCLSGLVFMRGATDSLARTDRSDAAAVLVLWPVFVLWTLLYWCGGWFARSLR